MKSSKHIPDFKSIEEEADFWDTHDFIDLEPLTDEDMRQTITIRVRPTLKKKLMHIAKRNGLSTSALTRIWLIDKLSNYQKTGQIKHNI